MAEEISVIEYIGTPIAELGRLPATGQDAYQTVVSWTVPEGYQGMLHEVSFVSSNYNKTYFKLTIAGTEQFTDKRVQAALSLIWRGNKLASGSVVKLEAKSDGTPIVVDGSITGTTLGE